MPCAAAGTPRSSLVADLGGVVVGHVLFSDLAIRTDGGTVPALALAPMAILPEFQRKGIGSTLVQVGLEACRGAGHRIVVVLGHSDFYPRFGFSAKLAEPLLSPFSGRDSWMALELVPRSLVGVTGWVDYPRLLGQACRSAPSTGPTGTSGCGCAPPFGRMTARANTATM